MTRASLGFANVTYANLDGGILTRASLDGADLTDAQLGPIRQWCRLAGLSPIPKPANSGAGQQNRPVRTANMTPVHGSRMTTKVDTSQLVASR